MDNMTELLAKALPAEDQEARQEKMQSWEDKKEQLAPQLTAPWRNSDGRGGRLGDGSGLLSAIAASIMGGGGGLGFGAAPLTLLDPLGGGGGGHAFGMEGQGYGRRGPAQREGSWRWHHLDCLPAVYWREARVNGISNLRGIPAPEQSLVRQRLHLSSRKYGLKSSRELEEYTTLVGDQVAEALATPGGADVLLAGDFIGHTGSLPDFADHSALLQAALDEAAEEVLAAELQVLPEIPEYRPATAAQLQHLAATASSDPLQAASQLHAVLYNAAAAVFPTANTAPRQRAGSTSSQLRRRHQPWFDAECAAARQQIRHQMQASLASGQQSHLAKEALRIVSNRYILLRKRKSGAWRRQQGSALLQLQRKDPNKFYKRWQREHPTSPIDAASWLRHFVNLQLQRTFKPSSGRTNAPSSPAAQQAAGGTASPPPPDIELDSDITGADVAAALKKLSPSNASLGPLKAVLIKAGGDTLTPVLAALFTAVLRSGCFPPEWALGAITPIHKKGDTSDPNNYRGITVGHVLGKLYALVINASLTSCLV
ncbi:hypothetical protein CHLNCDRAFT_138418 [Chlorella variabilis]|uniref:Reverse transcriptase domain-containing protein n=1 Tax=Chlorella variabilis TaxID=554065 RepID=E1ZN06_CHLVA|nr:hypothetical protein CHLNCDRAFT_138418 [Chlorella variabilis]EFN52889.1 hypothetical protein CHLNCDRAFT_138418 [Chlorella variabilis]|eukprot:XP_005844991.1 hypothetical protein CHLNCDRAFT_138418 [Chlorella variabilis]